MKHFLDDNFVLQNETAQQLYHEHAKSLPIIDYHCHLDPKMIAENYQFDNLGEIWLSGIITNGVQCAPTALTKGFVQEKIPAIGKSLRNGQKQCPTPCVTRYITGRIWN